MTSFGHIFVKFIATYSYTSQSKKKKGNVKIMRMFYYYFRCPAFQAHGRIELAQPLELRLGHVDLVDRMWAEVFKS